MSSSGAVLATTHTHTLTLPHVLIGTGSEMSSKGLKEIRKFVQQAKKLDKLQPSVAYYCRMAAVLAGMKIQNKSVEEDAALRDLMGWLENNSVGSLAF